MIEWNDGVAQWDDSLYTWSSVAIEVAPVAPSNLVADVP